MVIYEFSTTPKPAPARKKRPGSIGNRTRFAQQGRALHARQTVTAAWYGNQDYVISPLQVVNTRTNFLHNSSGFVTKH